MAALWIRGPGGVRHVQVGNTENVIGALLRFLCGATWRVDRDTERSTDRCPDCAAALERGDRARSVL